MYGDLQGIAGKSLQEIEGLEFPALESELNIGQTYECSYTLPVSSIIPPSAGVGTRQNANCVLAWRRVPCIRSDSGWGKYKTANSQIFVGLLWLVTAKLEKLPEHHEELSEDAKSDFLPSATIEDILSHIRSLNDVVRDGNIDGLTKLSLANLDEKICSITTEVVDAELPYFSNAISSLSDVGRRNSPNASCRDFYSEL